MPSCEKCWVDAHAGDHTGEGHAKMYARLIRERNCTPEEQAGEDAGTCPHCGRRAVHQYCDVCMACHKKPDDV